MSINSSSTGGFLQPSQQPPVLITTPPNLSLVQFIQTVLVGLSAFPGTLVRPDWQVEPPKEPDISVDWMAFGIQTATPDANAYIGFDQNDITYLQRNELLQVTCSVYGPNAYDNVGLVRDGFQIPQNLTSLKKANMGFAYDSPARHIPDFINGRWNDRWVTEIFLRRQIQRYYGILTFLSASGVIYTQTAEDLNYSLTWKTGS
jgi:hypothetical protein